jgi:hypothetical protein
MFATARAISRPPGDYAQRQLLGLGTVIDTLYHGYRSRCRGNFVWREHLQTLAMTSFTVPYCPRLLGNLPPHLQKRVFAQQCRQVCQVGALDHRLATDHRSKERLLFCLRVMRTDDPMRSCCGLPAAGAHHEPLTTAGHSPLGLEGVSETQKTHGADNGWHEDSGENGVQP